MHAAPGTPFLSVTCWKCWQTGNKAVSCQLGHLLPKALQSHLPFISLALNNNLSVVQPITHRLASAQGVVQPALLVKAIRGHIRVGKCLLMCLSLWNAISPLGDEIALVPLVLEQQPAGLAVTQRYAGPRWHFCMHPLEALQKWSSTHCTERAGSA